jgi:hypothetical protein
MAMVRAARERKELGLPPAKTDVVTLDLTEQVLDTEGQLIQYILWEYDQGRNPTEIKVSPNQAVNIANFTRIKPVRMYQSPFGNHNIRIVTAKDRENEKETV